MAGTIVVDTIQSDSSYASQINVTSNVAFTSPVNFTGGMQVGGQDFMAGMRNRIINGAMRIDQRNAGASVSHLGNSGVVIYPVDRTFVYNNTGTANTAVTAQQVAVTADIGFDYAIRSTIGNTTSRNTWDGRFQHNIEGNNVADYIMGVTTMVVTFWARASKAGYAYYSIWSSNAGTGAYLYKRISLTTDWQKFTISIPACTLPGAALQKNNNRGFGSGLYWASAGWTEALDGQWATTAQLGVTNYDAFSASGDWIEFTGYQLEYGTTPTAFEFRPYQQELALCQRYYWQTGGPFQNVPAWTWVSTQFGSTIWNPVPMRASPTVASVTSTNAYIFYMAGTTTSFNSVSVNAANLYCFDIYATTSGKTAGQGGFFGFTASGNITSSAEL